MTDARTATVTIERRGVGLFEFISGFFDVRVDGHSVATLARYGDVATLELAPGAHTLTVQHDRYSSRELEIEAFAGGTLRFRTHGAMLPPRWLASLAKPDLGINLHRV